MLKYLIDKQSNTNKLLTAINDKKAVSIFGLNDGEKLSILNDCSKVLFVAGSDNEAVNIYETLTQANKSAKLLTSKLSYEYGCNNESEYANNLSLILLDQIQFLVVSPQVLISKLPQKIEILNQIRVLKLDEKINLKQLKNQIIKLGYKHSEVVTQVNEFNFKGDLLTIYSNNYSNPVRISFFDDVVENIKIYDLNTLKTISELDEFVLITNKLLQANSNFPHIYDKRDDRESAEKIDDIISKVQMKYLNGTVCTWLYPFFNIETNILDYFDNDYVVFDSPKQIINTLQKVDGQIKEEVNCLISSGQFTKHHKNCYFESKNIFHFKKDCGLIAFQNINNANKIFKPNAVFNISTTPLLNYNFYTETLVDDLVRYKHQNYTVIVYCVNPEFTNKLKLQLQKHKIESFEIGSVTRVNFNEINLLSKSGTYSVCFNENKLLIINLNSHKKQRKNVTSEFNGFLPQVNDYVVHNTFGIGKCLSIQKMQVNNTIKDYIEIEYKNNDKLFLPVENIDSLSKYIGSDKTPKLNKLGSGDFLKTKQKVRTKLKELSINLKQLYAKRNEIKGIEYPKDDEIQQEFENDFPYELTIDQQKAITDVKNDMCSSKVMDRLICGDVGFGKTEVAIRATYKAVMSGFQVAFLCPTTILSEQHYNTCIARMKEFGVRVEVLNRFKTSKEIKQTLSDLADGKIDVICGTHRLLSKDVTFKNLGLLVLDEEQRFGVEDKEKIKNLKSNIDVLTLSATPIPRTMHISLIGAKDISIIETPPMQRIPIVSQVAEFNESQVKFFIDRELKRDGQVLIIYNRVETIYEFCSYIKRLVGENVIVDVAHGQMPEKQLEDAIFKLYKGETQILISTTLIENGVDLPNANTLIIINADLLGISQLYQLKGRIGRSDKQGYALFTYPQHKILTEESIKRLEAIMEYSGLGNGFKIAMRDLEIRGAGSVFGAEQSGHIESVGYSMYLSLLTDVSNELDGKQTKSLSDVKIESVFSANIPTYYIEDTNNRIEVYSSISKLLSTTEQNELIKKLEFNYGVVPMEVENLCYIARIKNIAQKLNCNKVNIKYNQTFIYFNEMQNEIIKNITQLMDKNNNLVLNLEKLPILTINHTLTGKENLKSIINIFEILTNKQV